MKSSAAKHNASGTKFLDRGDYKAAEKRFIRATKAEPTWSVPWYHLGLVYKRQKRWELSLRCNRRAADLDAKDQAAWWNMGIAATAVGNWADARRAWIAFGVPLAPEEEGPITIPNLGPTPIRINPDRESEVVWCNRIDPARAIIENIPLPQSGHCFGDTLLHDGEPKGYRMVHKREVPVFDELEILEKSAYQTYEVKVFFRSLEDIEVLTDLADRYDLSVEDWGTLRHLCKLCSEGKPHKHHQPTPRAIDDPIQLGLAAQDEAEIDKLFEAWSAERQGCRLSALTCVFKHS